LAFINLLLITIALLFASILAIFPYYFPIFFYIISSAFPRKSRTHPSPIEEAVNNFGTFPFPGFRFLIFFAKKMPLNNNKNQSYAASFHAGCHEF
jgi:hypothetical protein